MLSDLLTELARREKEGGILPEAEVDLFMKATAIEGVKSSLQTDYTLRVRSSHSICERFQGGSNWMLVLDASGIEGKRF